MQKQPFTLTAQKAFYNTYKEAFSSGACVSAHTNRRGKGEGAKTRVQIDTAYTVAMFANAAKKRRQLIIKEY